MPDRQCTAKSKSTGERCKRYAIPGGTVCRWHGGKAGQVAKAARRRVEAAEVWNEIGRLGVPIPTGDGEALVAMRDEANGNVTVLRRLTEGLDAFYGDLYHENGSPTGRAEPHVLVVMYNQERDRLAKLDEMCLRLGLAERQVRVSEVHAARLLDAVTGAVSDAGLTGEQTARLRQALADRLRRTA